MEIQSVKSFLTFLKGGKGSQHCWLLEERFSKPWHLKTHHMRYRRDVFRCRAAWFLSAFGIHLPHMRISVTVGEGSVYDRMKGSFDYLGLSVRHLAIPNTRAVVFAKDRRREIFVKVPMSNYATAHIENERSALMELQLDPDIRPLLPNRVDFAGHLALENMRSRGTRRGRLPLSEILRVHELLYNRSRTFVTIGNMKKPAFVSGFVKPGHKDVQHPASMVQLVRQTRDITTAYLSRFRDTDMVDCYMAHGDFHASNALVAADGTARILDWEHFGLKPRYFDVISYLATDDLFGNDPAEKLSQLKRIGDRIEIGSSDFKWIDYVGFYFSIRAIKFCELIKYGNPASKSLYLKYQSMIRLISNETSRG